MARLEEEEREQREADDKVTVRSSTPPSYALSLICACKVAAARLRTFSDLLLLLFGLTGSQEAIRGDPRGTAEEVGRAHNTCLSLEGNHKSAASREEFHVT